MDYQQKQGSANKVPSRKWIAGGANFKVTHYSYAVEHDPFYDNNNQTDEVDAPGITDRKFKRGFLGVEKNGKTLPASKNVGISMQGTGQTADGKYVMWDGAKDGVSKFKYGVGGAHKQVTRPFEQIAVDPSVIPFGTKVYVEAYDKVMSADDRGGKINGKHIDIFAGPKTYSEILQLKTNSSRLAIVDDNTPTGSQDSAGGSITTNTTGNSGTSGTTTTGNEQVYIVKGGDTLSKIASQFNVAGGYQALAAFNNISNPNRISVGQKIRIPGTTATTTTITEKTDGKTTVVNNNTPTGGTSSTATTGNEQVYVVKGGDTLSKIASQFNVAGGYQALAAFNNISNPNRISVGQKIRIPGTTATTTTVTEKTDGKTTTPGKTEENREPESKTELTTSVVVNNALNIRSEPNTKCSILGTLHNGDKVTYTEDKNGWLRITSPKVGYISKKYTKLNSETAGGVSNQKEDKKDTNQSGSGVQNGNTENASSEECTTGRKAVTYAEQFLGNPYVWAGKGQLITQAQVDQYKTWGNPPYAQKKSNGEWGTTWGERYDWLVKNYAGLHGFDCSGLCCYSYKHGANYDISNNNRGEQPNRDKAIWVYDGHPDVKQMKVGDVIVSKGHYQLYYGNGKAIESCGSKGVTNTLSWNYNGVKAVYRYFND